MKSVSELLSKFFSRVKADNPSRRQSRRATIGHTEAVEPRLLLTVNLNEALYDPLVLQEPEASGPVNAYLVKFDSAQNTATLQAATGADSVTRSPYINNAYRFEFAGGVEISDAAETFSQLSGFEYLNPDLALVPEPLAIPNDPLFADQWHLRNTGQQAGYVVGADSNVETVWDNYTGNGVTIGIVDTGLETGHEDFVGNINTTIDRDFIDFDDDPNPVDPQGGITEDHGTSVAGVAAAKGNNGVGGTGAAWDAEIVGLRILDGLTGHTDRQTATFLTHENQQIDIYNNSWGFRAGGRALSGFPETLAALEDTATTGRGGLGNIHVFAAGNDAAFDDNVNYTRFAKSRHTIAVGALLPDGTRASYSEPGAPLIVSGYADPVTTADRTGAAGYDATNYTATFNGTSSAAPHVSGVIALMLEANPQLTYRDVVDILVHTSERVDAQDSDWAQNGAGLWVNHNFGFGGIDARAAVDAALVHEPLAQELTYSTGTQTVLVDIPDNIGSVSQTVTVPASENLSLEYVELVFNATHTFIGDLEITLTSPDGTQSVLAETRLDPGTAYNNYVFMSARHWDEFSAGDWTVTVSDGAAIDTGTFDSFELVFYGTAPDPVVVTESNGSTVVEDFGQADAVTVSLAIQPTSDVVLNVFSQDDTEVTVAPTTLTFTPANYNIPQTVAITGVSDLIEDGDQSTNVVVAVNPTLSDPFYASLSPKTVQVTSIDNDGRLPGKPVLSSPVGLIDTNRPTFQWTTVDNAFQYRVTVRNVFTDALVQEEVVSRINSVVLQSPFVDGVYEATVTGINVDGQAGPSSDPVIFGVGDIQTPTTPVIDSPTMGSTVTNAQVPIVWTSVPGALTYDIYMSTTQGVVRVEDRGTDAGNGLRQYVPTTPFPEGNVSVWIRALDPFGGVSNWSTPTRFLVDAVPAPQRPVITSPLVSVTSNAFPEFSWVGDGATYELWVAKLREGTGTAQVPAVFDRTVYLRDFTGNNYTHFNPLQNGQYRVWVRARNVAGELSAWSTFEEFTVDVPTPSTPALTVDLGANSTRPLFSWTTTDETFLPGTQFDLWVNNLSTGEARVIRERTLTGSSYRPPEDLPQGRYRAWVQASSPLGQKSAWSVAVTFDVDIVAPGAPTMTGPVAAAGSTDGLIRTVMPEFSWTAQPGAAYYELWVNRDSPTQQTRIVHERQVEGTTFTSETPLPQGDYRAWTRAFNVAGEPGPWSPAFSFTLDVEAPAAPIVIGPVKNAVGTVGDSTPTIAWTASGGSVVAYQVQLEEVATGTRILDVTDIAGEEYVVPTTLSEQEYRVRVRGLNIVGEVSAWSSYYNFTIDVPNASTPILIAPNNERTGGTVTFEWQHSNLNTRYEILVRDLLRQENVVIRVETFELDLSQTIALHTQSGFESGTYRWWVRAFNSENSASNWSAAATFTVAGTQQTPRATDEELLDLESLVAVLPAEAKTDSEAVAPVKESTVPQVSVRQQSRLETDQVAASEIAIVTDIADQADLIQVISELADPQTALLLDGEARS